MIKLIARDGSLFVPNGSEEPNILLVVYPAGDCDRIKWPMRKKDTTNLKAALYDAREMGQIPADCANVLLPNGKTFEITDSN